jgi:hypothetical protein
MDALKSTVEKGQAEEPQQENELEASSKPPSQPASSTCSSDEDETSRLTSIAEKRTSLPPSPSSNYIGKNSWRRQDTFNSDSGISVSSSPETNDQADRAPNKQKSDSDSNAESSSDSDEEDDSPTRPNPTGRSSSTTVTGAVPTRKVLPDNDPLVQQLLEQEEERRLHILHSPQPHRTFRPQVTSSYEPSPVLPMFDYRATSAAPPSYAFPPHAPNIPHGNFLHPQYAHQMPIPPVAPFELDPKKKTMAGYEMVASKLAEQNQDLISSEQPWHPVYRKFAHLNHRVLLHLQDEISELEEELQILDESIAQMTAITEDDILQPASRRAETRFGSELHHRRTEILGRIFVKLGQYNQALSSYNSATQNFPPAEKTEVAAYRTWMEQNAPIDETESRFLNHELDLMTLGKKSPATPHHPINLRHDKRILFAAMLILPIAISLVSGFVAKMVVIGVLAAAGVIVLESRGVVGVGHTEHVSARDDAATAGKSIMRRQL